MNKLTIVSAVLTGLLVVTSCGSKEVQNIEKVRPVKSMIIGDLGDPTGKGFPGATKETQESEMSFRVSGPIIKLNVVEGARVRSGALIAELDPRDYQVMVQSTEARYNQTKAESDRFYRLWQKGSVAKNEYERRFANYLEAEAAWEDAKNALIDTKLFAPYTGFYGRKLAQLGEEVTPNQAITSIVDLSVIEVTTTIPEQLAVQLLAFDQYEVHIETYPDQVFSATLKELEKKPTAEGFQLHLFLDHKNNPNDPDQNKVTAGMSCRVNILLRKDEGEAGKIIIPITAVFESNTDNNTSVWIIDVDSSTVNKQTVVVGDIVGNDAIQIVEGLSLGQQIVVAGVHRLTEGDIIKVIEQTN
ncbi:MAG: efflux RND transporter periplasmic adaptor subunit [Cyclobacteriaceae bacterium]|nr:efflux RND transporter periplasmic adaptor subunit [Cyclobacteriaceae bacterium]